ncbi:MAG: T9SS C-terminal target domain-containing protein [Cytophagales bacterium]|nr:MAG: T9SS C-terminal target domain-containing protein [Cytophagales bacterium]
MIKNYILATMFASIASLSMAQMKNYTVGKTLSTIKVDGVIDADYMAGGMQMLENCIDNSTLDCNMPPATGCDKTTKWAALWNDNSLFVVAEVVDANLGTGDAIELFFSMTNDKTSNCPANWPRAYNASTFQIVSGSPTGNLDSLKVSSPNGQVGNVVAQAAKLTANGYIMEFELSWFEMDFLTTPALIPVIGRKIGFDISNNQGIATRTAQSMWNQNGGNRNWTDPSGFGTITLGDVVNSVNKLNSLVNKVSIAPNPAADLVNVTINAKQQDEVSISIINSLSQKVYNNNQAVVAGETKHEIATDNLPNGIYTVVISKGNLSATEKLVINK